MNKIARGLLIGTGAGIIDVIPMLLQGLPWNANVSAFLTWLGIGMLLPVINLRTHPIIKGLATSFLIVIPHMFIIGEAEPYSLIPVTIMTLILGSLAGYADGWLESRNTFKF
ncbi:MAG TPA: hypothetical protein VHP30_05340 [Ignavibacteriales bacterium]|nr:hypothetical protein [Ignavibacteriales bacterium]